MRRLAKVSPLRRYMRVVLTNGAVVTMPTVAEKTAPFLASADAFSASLWELKTAVQTSDVAREAEKQRAKVQKLADFYKKFGYGEEEGEGGEEGEEGELLEGPAGGK
jgi:predicted phage gp36 major capsid-like protein